MNQQILTTIRQGLNEQEQRIFEMFYEPSLRGSWLFVSKEMVCDYMGYASMDWQRHFFNRIMSKWLTIDVDYRAVGYDDPVVTEYFRSTSMSNGIKAPPQVNNKNYYLITGDAFQSLCMAANTTKGRETRVYYKKMADLALHLTIQNARLIEENSRLDQQAILIADNKIMELEKCNLDLVQTMVAKQLAVAEVVRERLLEKIQKPMPTEYFYMLTTWSYSRRGLFKFSYATADINSRLISMNSGHTIEDKLVILHRWTTTDAGELKRRVLRMLERLRHSNNRDFYVGSYSYFRDVVDKLHERLNLDDDDYDDACQDLVDGLGVNDPLHGLDAAVLLRVQDSPVHAVLAAAKTLTWHDVKTALAAHKGITYSAKRTSTRFKNLLAAWMTEYQDYSKTAGALVVV